MMFQLSLRSLVLACALVPWFLGCGGSSSSSGVARDKYFDQLTQAEIEKLCAWGVAAEGGPGAYSCPDGHSGEVSTVDGCVSDLADDAPHCQVAMLEDCLNSINGDMCHFATDACKAYVACVLPGQ